MARSKAFEPDEALDAVTRTFWARGYASTSIADLEEATGLGRQSLYTTFGSKHDLFLLALERYARKGSCGILDTLLAESGGLEALRRYLHWLADYHARDGERPACLMVNTILEFAGRDGDVRERCHANTRGITNGIARTLDSAVARGELAPDADVPALARMLTAQVYGMSVLAEDGATVAELQASIDALVNGLRH